MCVDGESFPECVHFFSRASVTAGKVESVPVSEWLLLVCCFLLCVNMSRTVGLLRCPDESLHTIPDCLSVFWAVVAAAGAGTGGGQAPAAVPGAGGAAGGGLPDLGGLAGLGLPDLGMLGGGGGLLDPAMMQQMLQNPQVQQMMQGLLSNPAYMNQVGVFVSLSTVLMPCPVLFPLVGCQGVGGFLDWCES